MYSSSSSSSISAASAESLFPTTGYTFNRHFIVRLSSFYATNGTSTPPRRNSSDLEVGSIISDGDTTHRRRFTFTPPPLHTPTFDTTAAEIGVSPLPVPKPRPLLPAELLSRSSTVSETSTNKRIDADARRASIMTLGSRFHNISPSPPVAVSRRASLDDLDSLCQEIRYGRPRSALIVVPQFLMSDGGVDNDEDGEMTLAQVLAAGPVDAFVPRRSNSGSKFREELTFPTRAENPLQWIRQQARRTMRRTSMEIPGFFGREKSGKGKVLITFTSRRLFGKKDKERPREQQELPDLRLLLSDEHDLKRLPSKNTELDLSSGKKRSSTSSKSAIHQPQPGPGELGNLEPPRTRTPTRLAALRDTVGKGFGGPSPTRGSDKFLIPIDTTRSGPRRPHTAPPEGAQTELEFLTTEATGMITPPESPSFNPENLGSSTRSHRNEMEYSNQQQHTVQSPNSQEFYRSKSPTPTILAEGHPNLNNIAPFLEQDKALKNRETEIKSIAKSHESRRSLTITKAWRRSTTLSPDLISRSSSTPPERSHRPALDRPKSPKLVPQPSELGDTTGSRRSFGAWLEKRRQIDGPEGAIRPLEVMLEEMRREERDTGVIGLREQEGEEEEEGLSDESVSYAAATREIAGLGRRLRGRGRRGSVQVGKEEGTVEEDDEDMAGVEVVGEKRKREGKEVEVLIG